MARPAARGTHAARGRRARGSAASWSCASPPAACASDTAQGQRNSVASRRKPRWHRSGGRRAGGRTAGLRRYRRQRPAHRPARRRRGRPAQRSAVSVSPAARRTPAGKSAVGLAPGRSSTDAVGTFKSMLVAWPTAFFVQDLAPGSFSSACPRPLSSASRPRCRLPWPAPPVRRRGRRPPSPFFAPKTYRNAFSLGKTALHRFIRLLKRAVSVRGQYDIIHLYP